MKKINTMIIFALLLTAGIVEGHEAKGIQEKYTCHIDIDVYEGNFGQIPGGTGSEREIKMRFFRKGSNLNNLDLDDYTIGFYLRNKSLHMLDECIVTSHTTFQERNSPIRKELRITEAHCKKNSQNKFKLMFKNVRLTRKGVNYIDSKGYLNSKCADERYLLRNSSECNKLHSYENLLQIDGKKFPLLWCRN